MKAKEYAQIAIDAGYSPESFSRIIKDLTTEVYTLSKDRKCQTADAFNAVFKEMDQKYRAICSIVNRNQPVKIMREEGFKECMRIVYAEAKNIISLDYFK